MKVLIAAPGPQMRPALTAQFEKRARPFACFELSELEALMRQARPGDIVLSAMALESDDEARVERMAQLASHCAEQQLPVLHLSSSLVFDGLAEGRYAEDDPVEPASDAALRIWRMEEMLREDCLRHIVLRSGQLFSASGDNVLTRLLAQLRGGGSLPLSARGQSCPVHAEDLARVASALIDQIDCGAEVWGSYHYCSADPATHFQFAETVLALTSQYLDVVGLQLSLEPLDEVDHAWMQPMLSCEKLRNTFGVKQLLWRAYISASVRALMEKDNE